MAQFKKPLVLFFRSFGDLMKSSAVYRRTAVASLVFVLLTGLLPLWRILPMALVPNDFSDPEKTFRLFGWAPSYLFGNLALPLHYNIYSGIDRFGPWYYVFAPAVLGAALLLINLVFEAAFFRREHVLSYFFACATVFAELVLLVAVVLIVLLNL